jgi:hypothetical protein
LSVKIEPPADQPSAQITVPVLVVVGADDIFCADVTANNCVSAAAV